MDTATPKYVKLDDQQPYPKLTPDEQRERAHEMHRLYQGPPGKSLEDVGNTYGLTKERVRQIFGQFDLPIRFPRPRKER